jgi:hypothetical protein
MLFGLENADYMEKPFLYADNPIYFIPVNCCSSEFFLEKCCNRGIARSFQDSSGKKYGRTPLNHKEPKIIDHLAFISVKNNVYLSELYQAIVTAETTGKAKCQNLSIEYRGTKNNQPVFLITKANTVVAQFSVDKEILQRQDISFDRWLDTDKIRKQMAKQKLCVGSMVIDNLRHGMKKVNLQAEVLAVEKPQLVHTQYGNNVMLTKALIADKSGQIKLSLWGDQAEFAAGNWVEIKHATVQTFKGERHLSLGKQGTFSIMPNGVDGLAQEEEQVSKGAVYA